MFIEDYPDSDLLPEVQNKLAESVHKLAKKEYMTGDLYRRMNHPKAAVISFNSVLEKYSDTEFAELALFWKSECHRRLNELDEAEIQFKDFIRNHSESDLIPQAEEKLKEIATEKRRLSKEASGSNNQ